MAKPLRHTKSGTKEVQRLLCHHIDRALKALQGNQPLSDAAVHGARKQLKKGRADLRLLRKALGSQTYAYENIALRDVLGRSWTHSTRSWSTVASKPMR